MSDDFIEQAQALKDENKRLREALAITSEALGKVKEIVDTLLHPEKQPNVSAPFIGSNTPPVPPVVEQPQTDPNQYTVTEFGDDEPHSGPYKVDVSGYINKD
tara:strand:+ start:10991 stop:11296 length:306 start_codon:yes stop_codon:yes gene_type:complete